jgi:hypothetical protein
VLESAEEGKDPQLPEGFCPLVGMLEMVAFKRSMAGMKGEDWAKAMRATLADVGVELLRQFVSLVLVLSRKLVEHHHDKKWCATTLNMMLMEVCDMLIWQVEAEGN